MAEQNGDADRRPDARPGERAYFVVWTLVRNLTAGYSPDMWQRRFQEGTLADMLLRPVHPVHGDIAGGFGFNLPQVVIAVPLTAALILVFRPDLSPRPARGRRVRRLGRRRVPAARRSSFCVVGTVGFWTTRVDAASRLYMAAELLLSGSARSDRAVSGVAGVDGDVAAVPVHVRVPDRGPHDIDVDRFADRGVRRGRSRGSWCWRCCSVVVAVRDPTLRRGGDLMPLAASVRSTRMRTWGALWRIRVVARTALSGEPAPERRAGLRRSRDRRGRDPTRLQQRRRDQRLGGTGAPRRPRYLHDPRRGHPGARVAGHVDCSMQDVQEGTFDAVLLMPADEQLIVTRGSCRSGICPAS